MSKLCKAAQINSEYGPHNHKATQISLRIAEITIELQKLAFETTQIVAKLPKVFKTVQITSKAAQISPECGSNNYKAAKISL